MLCRGLEENRMVRAWHGRSLASVNQTRPHRVNQMGKTHSKHLAARHGIGTAWTRHAVCESAFIVSLGSQHLVSVSRTSYIPFISIIVLQVRIMYFNWELYILIYTVVRMCHWPFFINVSEKTWWHSMLSRCKWRHSQTWGGEEPYSLQCLQF
jgi:hypothetical protein